MLFTEVLRAALGALAANTLRSLLTMLGIVVGVAAVIALISIGQGVERFVTEEFQGIGSNLLFVFPGEPDQRRLDRPGQRSQPLTNEDAAALADPLRVPGAAAVAMEYSGFSAVEYGRVNTTAQVSGVSLNYQEVRQFFVNEGEFFTENDERSAARVAVLGQTAAKALFAEGEYPLGQTIKINGLPFKVIGLLALKGGGLFGDQDNVVMVPISTAQQRLFDARTPNGRYSLSIVYVQARHNGLMDDVAQQITALLRDRHNISFRDEDDFTVITQADLIASFGEVTGALTLFLGLIAGVSLLVGGIGIMNIMLVSVTERTREIGLRKAVGAKRRDVLLQFLIEAITLAVLGGVIGVAIGVALAEAVVLFRPDLPMAVTGQSILLATGVSATIGLLFGLYPAARAARLNPMDALRYE